MKRLRHPIRAVREPFGTAGVVLGVIALILALGGTALAAKGALTGKQKKEVEKIAKKYAGKDGAPGAPGTNGTNGTNGKDGAKGERGEQGEQGKQGIQGVKGDPGDPGESPEELAALAPGENGCVSGGVLYGTPNGDQFPICNGKEGKDGIEGQPWTDLGTLPPGATETGTWDFNGGITTFTVEVEGTKNEITIGDTKGIRVPISFPIPYSFNLKPAHVHFGEVNSGGAFVEETTEPPSSGGICPAKSAFTPKAKPGELCVYANLSEGLVNATFSGINRLSGTIPGAAAAGAMLKFIPTGPEAVGGGSFAVTGCTKTPVTPGEPNECPAGS